MRIAVSPEILIVATERIHMDHDAFYDRVYNDVQ